uniref:Proteoglycan 4-like n=1 Tax=Tanacetum cinerariifolium TaxID=118510 RepID=A0A6L2LJI7_TANCI|nr:proteoglycan 4-like [Tanacetum cinerariifolium]
MTTETKSNMVDKMKPDDNSGIQDAKTKFDPSVIKNRVCDGSIDPIEKFTTTTTKSEAKGKSIVTSSKTKTTTVVKKREKKVYSLPGQKFDVPEEREPLRIFYESLSKQIPSSEMAEFWLMEHGMLSPERAKKAYEKKQRRQKQIRMGTPIKSPPPSRGESSKKPTQQFSPPSRGESSKKPQQFSPASRGESSNKPQPVSKNGDAKPESRGESSIKPQQFSPPSRGDSSNKPQPVSKNGDAKPPKRVINDSDDDDDFVLSHKRRKSKVELEMAVGPDLRETDEPQRERGEKNFVCEFLERERNERNEVADSVCTVSRAPITLLALYSLLPYYIIKRNSTHTEEDASQNSGGGPRRPVQPARVCSYTDFMKCQPLNFKGTEGVVDLSCWVEKKEYLFHISSCTVENQVKFTTCTMLDVALTCWNGHVRTLGHGDAYAMTWETFKKRLTDKYCPKGEIKKLEIELWDLKFKGNDVGGYTQRFQELALLCTKFLSDETEKVDKYISGLPDNIHGNVMSARPKTLDFAIELANELMDQKLRTYAKRQAENKRKLDNNN